jgi:uroporphyrinogen-III synthase
MARPLLVLRPQPGNDETAARAWARGLAVVRAPLFAIVAADRAPFPDGRFDALLVTSANGARFGADILARFTDLPLYAVGAATAAAARAAGHGTVVVGAGEAAGTASVMAAAGHRDVLHICGGDVRRFDPYDMRIVRYIVYRAVETDAAAVSGALDSLGEAVALVHSPRAGARLAALVPLPDRARIAIAAISPAAAQACGAGWSALMVSPRPDDTALLQVAESLCISVE